MCNVLEWMSSVRVCACLGICVMVVQVEGGRSNTGNNCLANVFDGFSFQPFLAFPSISLHDVRGKKKGRERKERNRNTSDKAGAGAGARSENEEGRKEE